MNFNTENDNMKYDLKHDVSSPNKMNPQHIPEHEKIFMVIDEHKGYWNLKYGKDTSFVPMPATWLNQKRFEDKLNFTGIINGPSHFREISTEASKEKERNAQLLLKKQQEEKEIRIECTRFSYGRGTSKRFCKRKICKEIQKILQL